VLCLTGEGIEDLTQTMSASVVQVCDGRALGIPVAALCEWKHNRYTREDENKERSGQHGEQRHLHFLLLDFLADVLRRPADHQPGDEDAEDGVKEHSVETSADAAEDDLVGLHIEERDEAAKGRVTVVHAVHGPAAGISGHCGKECRRANSESSFLAFHV